MSGDIDQDDVTENGIVVDPVNINGENPYRVVSADDLAETAILDGFIITGGYNNQTSHPAQWGGGLYVAEAPLVVRNVRLEGNLAAAGGGMFIREVGLPVVLEGVEFYTNTATINGGGLHTYNGSSPILTDVTFNGNSAVGMGGGMINYLGCNPILTGVTFTDKTALQGGGMANLFSSRPRLTNAIFVSNNSSGEGGGMYNSVSGPTLINVVFYNNVATVKGGGMANAASRPVLTNVTIYGNMAAEGGGMYNVGKEKDINGVLEVAASYPVVTNAILWGNNGGQIFNALYSGALVTYSNTQDGYGDPTNHNINADPMFVDPDSGNLRLGSGSPAIDSGTNAAVPWDIDDLDSDGLTTTERLHFDLDGFERIVDNISYGNDLNQFIVDMGAYESSLSPTAIELTSFSLKSPNQPVNTIIILWGGSLVLGSLFYLLRKRKKIEHPS